jgi:hypothetical protein
MTEPISKQILDRDNIDAFVTGNLTPTIALLRELVDYGVELIDRCVKRGGSLADLVITTHFFKHVVTMLDAVEIQLSRGAVFSAGVSSRSILEAYIYLAWILEKDTEIRGRQFYVWHLRQKRSWARRVIPGTSEYEHFKKHTAILSNMKDSKKSAILEAEARRQDLNISRILTNSKNNSINAVFDKLRKRHFDVAWYRPSGPCSIGDIAKKLQLDAEYDFFYSLFSDISHVGAFEKHVKFDGKAVVVEPIRSPEGIRTVVNVVATLALRVFRLIIGKFFPQDMESFKQSYITQWRTRFLSVPEIVVKDKAEGDP